MNKQVRRLFQEPSVEHEREDPWTGPKGFMLGGMALPTKVELAAQFFRAANALMQTIDNNECEDYKLVNPVLYLYRHALELLLKGGMSTKTHGHSLRHLADKLNEHVRKRHKREVAPWIIERLIEMDKVDPGGTAFRYAENKGKPVPGEMYVGFDSLRSEMTELFRALASLVGANIEELGGYAGNYDL